MSEAGNVSSEPRRTYHELVAALRSALDDGIEPPDEDLELVSLFRHPDAERDLAQLFYRRALVREERLEREEAEARARAQALLEVDDDDA